MKVPSKKFIRVEHWASRYVGVQVPGEIATVYWHMQPCRALAKVLRERVHGLYGYRVFVTEPGDPPNKRKLVLEL